MTNIDELRRRRILIADDSETQRSKLKSMLEEGGFTNILTAQNNRELRQVLQDALRNKQAAPDIILLANSLSDVNMYELCRDLGGNGECAGVPVVVMADGDGWWEENTARKSYESGAVDVLFRPIRIVELIPRIALALTLKQERDQRRREAEGMGTELIERKVMEARLQYLVAHDDLTGLSNRRRLEQALELAIIHARNFNRTSALLYLDLDQFKVINDTEGHDAGDRLLICVANLIRQRVKSTEIVARIGSDEFAILLENRSEADAMAAAESLRRALDSFPFQGEMRTYHIATSIGVAIISPEQETTVSEVLARADQACYVAKKHGRNMVHKFSHEDTELHRLRSDVHWVPMIRDALATNKFFLMFQPVVRVADGQVTHYEVLIRMRDENGEMHMPDEFIPVAERMGLIHHIDLWVVETAIDFLAALPPHQSHLSLAINLSSHAFQDKSLLPLVKQKLDMTWVSASRLTFEITETAAVANFVQTREMVARLRALGCRFALDDFGAGFNSFNYVKNFPVDYLKIDGAFIVNLIADSTDQVLVKSMIEIARSLGKMTIAEYVENPELLEMLRGFGVDFVQGNYVGKPAAELADAAAVRRLVARPQNPAPVPAGEGRWNEWVNQGARAWESDTPPSDAED